MRRSKLGAVSGQSINEILKSPVINTGVTGTAIKDEDNMSSDSATHLATQQSIKAFVVASITSIETARDKGGNAFVAGSLETIAHTLSGTPDIIQIYIKCIDAGGDGAWSQNDEVFISSGSINTDGGTAGISVYADATNVYIRLSSNASPIVIPEKDDGNVLAIAVAKWTMYVNAIYFG